MTQRTVLTIVTGLTIFMMGLVTGWLSGPERSCGTSETKIVRVLEIPDDNEAYEVTLPSRISLSQAQLLHMAYQTAKADGHPYPQLLQGILLQETLAGQVASYKVAGQEAGLKPMQRYYGVAQIKLAAAKDVLQRWPEMWKRFEFHTGTDDEVVAKLIEDDGFNIAVASKYLLILKEVGYNSPGALAVAYNKGPKGAMGVTVSANPYAQGVYRHIAQLSPMVPVVYR